MTYSAEYTEVYLPLVIDECSITELCCDIVLEEDYDDFICREIRIHSDRIDGKRELVLKRGDKKHKNIFDALEYHARLELSEQYFTDFNEAKEAA